MTITVYTDGGCSPNPGLGGWAAILTWEGHEKELFGSEKETTNNRMELTAAIKALETVKDLRHPVEVYTDSKYLCDGINQWCAGWESRGWRTSSGKRIENQDLWKQLLVLVRRHNVLFHWVKAHNGHTMNERVDRLVHVARTQFQPVRFLQAAAAPELSK